MKFGLYSSIANPPRGKQLDRWAGEQFSFRGKHYTLEDVQICPRPYPKSGPPM
jgi:hypothetical protein